MTQQAEPILVANIGDGQSESFGAKLAAHPLIHAAPGEGPGGADAVRVDYVGFPQGSERIVVRHRLPQTGDEMTLCFAVRFEDDFQFVRGGKMHGFVPDLPVTGGKATQAAGWSSRIMWRTGGALATYIYDQDKEGKWGIGIAAEDFRFEKNRWYAVSLHTRLNSAADAHDGFAHVYVDGRRLIEHNGLRFRAATDPGTEITHAYFCTFHGGNKPGWAPKDAEGNLTTVHALYSHFSVYEGLHVMTLDR